MQTISDSCHARFDGSSIGVAEDYLRRNVPSVFAREKHSSRSERFRPIATIDIIEALRGEGFLPVAAKQCTARDESRRDFTKHLVRFRRNDGIVRAVGDTVFEVILKNGNDGTACYELMAGLFRIRCTNSLVALSSQLDSLKIRHTGNDIQDRVIEGTYTVLGTAEKALAAPQDWSAIKTTKETALILAETAHQLRFEVSDGLVNTPIRPDQLLTPKRMDDRSDDLWTTFNVIQENCIKGGLRARNQNTRRRVTTREVKGIEQDVKLNRALWAMGEKMAELLKSAS
jgi:hypothetical protein